LAHLNLVLYSQTANWVNRSRKVFSDELQGNNRLDTT
jgi:hypothetical protein